MVFECAISNRDYIVSFSVIVYIFGYLDIKAIDANRYFGGFIRMV